MLLQREMSKAANIARKGFGNASYYTGLIVVDSKSHAWLINKESISERL